MPVTLVAKLAAATLSLTFHYPMTCGEPGPGPLVVRLPGMLQVTGLRATVGGYVRPASRSGSTIAIPLRKPPEITCMSIAEGTLRVHIRSVHARRGAYVLRAYLPRRSFAATLRVP